MLFFTQTGIIGADLIGFGAEGDHPVKPAALKGIEMLRGLGREVNPDFLQDLFD
jgi:hypothetical protein